MLRGLGADQSFARPVTGGRACRRTTAVPLTSHRPRRPSKDTARRLNGRVRAVATDDVAEAAWSTKEVLANQHFCGRSKALPPPAPRPEDPSRLSRNTHYAKRCCLLINITAGPYTAAGHVCLRCQELGCASLCAAVSRSTDAKCRAILHMCLPLPFTIWVVRLLLTARLKPGPLPCCGHASSSMR